PIRVLQYWLRSGIRAKRAYATIGAAGHHQFMPRTPEEPVSVNAHPVSDVAIGLLIEAGAVLASSLDMATTMGQVAQLTVPRLADLCVIDLVDEDGSIKDVAVASANEGLARQLEQLRASYPLDPQGAHPVAGVIRSGEPV